MHKHPLLYHTAIALCCLPGICSAQVSKFDFGLSIPLYLQANMQSGLDVFRRPFGVIGFHAVLRINGAEENDMSFMLAAGVRDDVRDFVVTVNDNIKLNLYFVDVNPSVVIPSRWKHIHYNLGIGALIRTGQGIDFSSSGQSYGGPGFTNLDTVNRILNTTSSGIVPYISLGLTTDINRHLKLQFTIEPTLLDFYSTGATINYVSSTSQYNIDLTYQPIYFGLKLFYFIHGNG